MASTQINAYSLQQPGLARGGGRWDICITRPLNFKVALMENHLLILRVAGVMMVLSDHNQSMGCRLIPVGPPFAMSNLLKLIVGAFVFLGLCGSLIFLVFSIGHILNGDIGTSSVIQLFMALSLVFLTSTVLYLLARKPWAQREALASNPVANQFAKRKLCFQLSSLVLVASAVLGMLLAVKSFQAGKGIAYIAVAFVAVGYWALGRTLWRCPACGYRLSFLRRHYDTQAISSCPACHVQLQ